jgi:hypothetical protein
MPWIDGQNKNSLRNASPPTTLPGLEYLLRVLFPLFVKKVYTTIANRRSGYSSNAKQNPKASVRGRDCSVKRKSRHWKSTDVWESVKSYIHPDISEAEVFGKVCLGIDPVTGDSYYYFRVGMSCSQEWAARIHAEETGEDSAGDLQVAFPWRVRP